MFVLLKFSSPLLMLLIMFMLVFKPIRLNRI